MKVVRVKKLEYRHGGIINYVQRNYKHVEVEGEVYTRQIVKDATFNLDNSFEKSKLLVGNNNSYGCAYTANGLWERREHIDLENYGIKIITWRDCQFVHNTNDFKHVYRLAFDFNDLPRWIKRVSYIGNCHRGTRQDEVYSSLCCGEVSIPIFWYGAGNIFAITVKTLDFLKIPFNLHSEYSSEILKENLGKYIPYKFFNGNISEYDLTKIGLKLFNIQIEYEKKLEQKRKHYQKLEL